MVAGVTGDQLRAALRSLDDLADNTKRIAKALELLAQQAGRDSDVGKAVMQAVQQRTAAQSTPAVTVPTDDFAEKRAAMPAHLRQSLGLD